MLGELAALTCALCWAIAARLYQGLGASFSPLMLNLYKGVLTLFGLGALMLLGPWQSDYSQNQLLWLLLSGAVGIGLGDTCFFKALKSIGDSQTLLIAETLAPIATALFALAWIGEWLSSQQWLAIALVLFGVDKVIRIGRKDNSKRLSLGGVGYAGLAALCQAFGAVISRDVLLLSGGDAASASFWRVLGGLLIIVPLMLLMRSRWVPKTHDALHTWGLFLLATFIGTLVAIYLQMFALTHTRAAVAQTLFAFSVVLSFALGHVLGNRVGPRIWGWSGVSVLGVALLVLA